MTTLDEEAIRRGPRRCDVAVAWRGIPYYAARVLRAAIDASQEAIEILGSSGPLSVSDVESTVGRHVVLVDLDAKPTWEGLGLATPRVFFFTGWSNRALNALARQVKRAGGLTISMIDNVPRRTLKQSLGSALYRLFLSRLIDEVFVPGNSSAELLRGFGQRSESIHTGLYCGDTAVFRPGPPLAGRPYDFAFVGQLIERKGVDVLVEAVALMRQHGVHSRVRAIGDGPLRDALQMAGIECLPFAGPAKVAETMAQSKFLVLPSRMEHWGVVVHEAALSGCGLLLSNAVGSVADLATRRNAILFPAGSPAALAAAMSEAVAMNAEQLERCSSTSLAVAARFSPEAWVRTFRGIVSKGLATSAGSQLFPPEVVPKVF